MLLERLGLGFEAVAPNADETPLAGETPAATAFRLANRQGAERRESVSRRAHHRLGSGRRLPGPADRQARQPRERRRATPRAYPARPSSFTQGSRCSTRRAASCQTALVDVRSTFRHLTSDEIEGYLRREQPYDCAGSVRSEALGIALFERIESDDPTALIGLPLIQLARMLRAAGVIVLAPPP